MSRRADKEAASVCTTVIIIIIIIIILNPCKNEDGKKIKKEIEKVWSVHTSLSGPQRENRRAVIRRYIAERQPRYVEKKTNVLCHRRSEQKFASPSRPEMHEQTRWSDPVFPLRYFYYFIIIINIEIKR